MLEKKAILITGANGLLGQKLLHMLTASVEVHALVRVMPAQPVSGVRYWVIDLSGQWSADQLPHQVETVVHLAQSSRFRDFPDQAMHIFKVNIESTARLLDYAYQRGVQRFIYASSGGVYGSGRRSFNENTQIAPASRLGYYLGSKLCGEVLAQSYAAHMQIVVLRFFFMYGPGQNHSMLVPRLVDNVKTGKPILLQGDVGIRLNPIHVDDAAQAVCGAIQSQDSFTVNIAGPSVLSMRELGQTIGEQLNREPSFIYQPTEDVCDLVADIRLMQEKLHNPRVYFNKGVRDMLESYR